MNTYQLAAKIIRLGNSEEPGTAIKEEPEGKSGHVKSERHNTPPSSLVSNVQDDSQHTACPSTDLVKEVLHAKKACSRFILDCIGDAVASTDEDGKINYLNLRAQNLTGWAINDAIGRSAPDVLQILNADTREAVPDYLDKAIRTDRTIYLPKDCVFLRRDGSEFPIEDSVAPIHNDKGHAIGAVIVFRDVSAAQAVKREIMHSAEYDYLTGLPNRLLLNDRVTQAISMASRHTKRIAILFMDLNGFKRINDSLGHATGDKLLQSISQRLLNCVRASDTVSRHGGDEFVVLLSELESFEGAITTAKKLLDAVAKPHFIDDQRLTVTASIGVSVYPEDGRDAYTLFYNADVAMYEAKDSPTGPGYRLYDPVRHLQRKRTTHRV
jgi:diguanylate cyclase (GGDEF)-like protein/PAS domain S-box-containing protein